MKIVNIDAPIELVEKVQSLMIPRFILDVIKPLEEKYYTILAGIQMVHPSKQYDPSTVILPTFPIRMFDDYIIGYETVATLIHTIPIYLRKKNPERGKGIIDLLGAYYPSKNRFMDSPYIELFLSPIEKESKKDDTHFKWLFTKVLLHELAHAAMDIYNVEGFQKMKEKVRYKSKFGEWREESMANAVALRIINIYGEKNFYNYAKKYILNNEPVEYKTGVLLAVDFDYWEFESIISGKIYGVDPRLKRKWLNYVKGKPTAEGLKEWNEALSSKFAYIFNNKIYSLYKKSNLIIDIVNTVLIKYKDNHNGVEMSHEEFKNMFNDYIIKQCLVEAAEPNSNYIIIQLGNVVYYLYRYWNSDQMKQFAEEVNAKFEEYENWNNQ